MVPSSARFLLLQVRDRDDEEYSREPNCFAAAVGCDLSRIESVDLLSSVPTLAQLKSSDVVLIGGSGRYSAAENKPVVATPGGDQEWLDRALDVLRDLYATSKPTFASCWGFQAMARALGGQVIHDPETAELGTLRLGLTPEGKQHPVFEHLSDGFLAQLGHEDRVASLPTNAVRLAFSRVVDNQAYCFPNLPIVATQFHPELDLENLLRRVRNYPEYIERILGIPFGEFEVSCQEAKGASQLLPRFVSYVLTGNVSSLD